MRRHITVHNRQHDTGAESVELAVLFPLALLLLLAVVQTGLWWHTHTVCRYAATQAIEAVRTTTGTPAEGQTAARELLSHAGSSATSPTVAVNADPAEVSVTVSATTLALIPLPGVDLRVSYTAHAPRERFIPAGGGGHL